MQQLSEGWRTNSRGAAPSRLHSVDRTGRPMALIPLSSAHLLVLLFIAWAISLHSSSSSALPAPTTWSMPPFPFTVGAPLSFAWPFPTTAFHALSWPAIWTALTSFSHEKEEPEDEEEAAGDEEPLIADQSQRDSHPQHLSTSRRLVLATMGAISSTILVVAVVVVMLSLLSQPSHLPLPVAAASPTPEPSIASEYVTDLSIPSSLLFQFGEGKPAPGFGFKLNNLLLAAVTCLSFHDNRTLFLSDSGWIYSSFLHLFLPPLPSAPHLPGWDDSAESNNAAAIHEAMAWPPLLSSLPITVRIRPSPANFSAGECSGGDALRCVPATSPSLSGMRGSLVYDIALTLPSSSYLSASSIPSASSAHLREYKHQQRTARHVSVDGGYAYGWWPDIRSTEPVPPPTWLPLFLSMSSPQMLMAYNNASHFLATHSLPMPHLLYVLEHRLMHRLLIVSPSIRRAVRKWLSRFQLRSGAKRRQKLLSAALRGDSVTWPFQTPTYSPGNAFIALHVRRQDKSRERPLVESRHYLEQVDDIIRGDPDLRAAFPAISPRMRNCTAKFYPQVVLLSDDINAVFTEMRELRPCYRFIYPDIATSLVARTDEVSYAAMTPALQEEEAERLLSALVLLSEADYTVLTYSSNIGRLVAMSRGWVDSVWEKHVRSVDGDSWTPW